MPLRRFVSRFALPGIVAWIDSAYLISKIRHHSPSKTSAKSHVKPQNCKSPLQTSEFAWRMSYLQSSILKSGVENRDPGHSPGFHRLKVSNRCNSFICKYLTVTHLE